MTEEVDKHVLKKFDIAQKLGKGAYGIVWKAYDRKDRSNVVALKKSIAQWTRTWYHRLPSPSCFLCPCCGSFRCLPERHRCAGEIQTELSR